MFRQSLVRPVMFYIFDMIVCGLQLIENGRQKIPLCSGATSRIRVAQFYQKYQVHQHLFEMRQNYGM